MQILLYALGGYMLYKQVAGSSKLADSLTYEVAAVRLNTSGITAFSAPIIVDLVINNPTNETATVQGIQGTVNDKATIIGSYSYAQPFTIPANKAVKLALNCRIENWSVLSTIINIVKSKQVPGLIIKGGINTSFGTISFDYPINDKINLAAK